MMKVWVHERFFFLQKLFQKDRYAEYNIRIQNGIPVKVKKIRKRKEKKKKN